MHLVRDRRWSETVASGATQLSINIFTVVQENTKLRAGYLDVDVDWSTNGPKSARDTFHYDYVCNGLLIVAYPEHPLGVNALKTRAYSLAPFSIVGSVNLSLLTYPRHDAAGSLLFLSSISTKFPERREKCKTGETAMYTIIRLEGPVRFESRKTKFRRVLEVEICKMFDNRRRNSNKNVTIVAVLANAKYGQTQGDW